MTLHSLISPYKKIFKKIKGKFRSKLFSILFCLFLMEIGDKKMNKKNLLILVFLFLFGASYIEIRDNVSNPEYYIKRAQKEVERLEKPNFFRSRKATSINIFVYDGESKDVVRVCLPLWLFKLCVDIAEDFKDDYPKYLRKHSKWDCEIAFRTLKEQRKNVWKIFKNIQTNDIEPWGLKVTKNLCIDHYRERS